MGKYLGEFISDLTDGAANSSEAQRHMHNIKKALVEVECHAETDKEEWGAKVSRSQKGEYKDRHHCAAQELNEGLRQKREINTLSNRYLSLFWRSPKSKKSAEARNKMRRATHKRGPIKSLGLWELGNWSSGACQSVY